MKRTVIQYRYYDNNNTHNYPTSADGTAITLQNINDGSIFLSEKKKEQYGNIVSLGIQTLPGTTFYLNGGVDPVIVGATGIFELDLTGYSEIYRLEFNETSLQTIQKTENGYLIVDAIYELEE